jgi:hypothetical protein
MGFARIFALTALMKAAMVVVDRCGAVVACPGMKMEEILIRCRSIAEVTCQY